MRCVPYNPSNQRLGFYSYNLIMYLRLFTLLKHVNGTFLHNDECHNTDVLLFQYGQI